MLGAWCGDERSLCYSRFPICGSQTSPFFPHEVAQWPDQGRAEQPSLLGSVNQFLCGLGARGTLPETGSSVLIVSKSKVSANLSVKILTGSIFHYRINLFYKIKLVSVPVP